MLETEKAETEAVAVVGALLARRIGLDEARRRRSGRTPLLAQTSRQKAKIE